MSEQTNQFKQIFSEGKEFLKLKVEYGKLTLAEKLTLLLSSLALGLICVFLGVIAIFFLSMSAVDMIAAWLGRTWASLIMCGCYLALIGTIFLARKPLLINPMSRLITRIILK